MTDTALNTSRAALKTKIDTAIGTASIDDARKLAKIAKLIGESDNTSFETAVNTRINSLATSATTDELVIYDASSDTNKAVTVSNLAAATHDVNSYAATITGFGTVTHNLGSYDVIVQLYNAATYETVYACVERTSVNAVAISGGTDFPAGDIGVLVSLADQLNRDYINYTPCDYQVKDPDETMEIPELRGSNGEKKETW